MKQNAAVCWLFGAVAVLLFGTDSPTNAAAQPDATSANQLARLRQVIGTEAVKAVLVKGTVRHLSPGRRAVPFTREVVLAPPDKLRMIEAYRAGGRIVETRRWVLNGDTSWQSTVYLPDSIPRAEVQSPPVDAVERARLRRLRLMLDRWAVVLLGRRPAHSTDEYLLPANADALDQLEVLAYEEHSGQRVTLFADKISGLPQSLRYRDLSPSVRSQRPAVRAELSSPPVMLKPGFIELSSYELRVHGHRPFSRSLFPSMVETFVGNQLQESWTLETIEVNPVIDPAKFTQGL